jgi:hypothetical protein
MGPVIKKFYVLIRKGRETGVLRRVQRAWRCSSNSRVHATSAKP